jgi:hypothetical protein
MQMVADGGPLDLGWGGPACLCPAAQQPGQDERDGPRQTSFSLV